MCLHLLLYLLNTGSAANCSMRYKPFEVEVNDNGDLMFLMSYICTPEKFWVHLVERDCAETVELLMKDLNSYYTDETTNKTMLKKFLETESPKVGDIVCSQFSEDQRYYRAEIIAVLSSQRIRVFYVDFGNEEWVDSYKIFPLPPQFVDIPPQAVCCSLAGVTPLEDSDSQGEWHRDAISEFVDMTGFVDPLCGFVCGRELGTKIRSVVIVLVIGHDYSCTAVLFHKISSMQIIYYYCS